MSANAITVDLHYSLSHLENKDSYIRTLFVDYSSAFYTVTPDKLSAHHHLWLEIRLHKNHLRLCHLPQRQHPNTAVIGCISGGDEVAHRREVASLVSWCEDNNLTLNTDKTKEMMVEKEKTSSATVHLGGWSTDGEQLQIPGHPHQWCSHLVIQNHAAGKEGPTAAVFSEKAEKVLSPEILSNFNNCIVESSSWVLLLWTANARREW